MEIQLWREILDPYVLAVDELTVKFNHIRNEYHKQGIYSPIEEVYGRVKSISSILEKTQKKKVDVGQVEEYVDDIAGIRVICQFVEDIEKVVDIIKRRDDMYVRSEKDYITYSKPSGYRSYHVNVDYIVQTLKGPKKLRVEIQIRTLAMNFWATIEHSLQYKYKENMPLELKNRLSKAADAIRMLDNEMSLVRGEIMDAQNSQNLKADVVADILSNIQNLYKVANQREVIKIQDEFYHIYSEGSLEKLERFNKELDIISEGYRAQSLT